MHKYVVATCRSFHARHSLIFSQHNEKLSEKFDWPFFILDYDSCDFLESNQSEYLPALWTKQLANSYHIHLYNSIYNDPVFNISSRSIKQRYLQLCDLAISSNLFPPRQLRLAEHSLLKKHYLALKFCVLKDQPLLVIEDDAIFNNDISIGFLDDSIKILNSTCGFLDLIGQPVAIKQGYSRPSHLISVVSLPVAMTNTTCAYVIHPNLAKTLCERFFPYSLPIDFHLQYLFCKLGLKGLTVTRPVFKNGTSIGKLASSVQTQ